MSDLDDMEDIGESLRVPIGNRVRMTGKGRAHCRSNALAFLDRTRKGDAPLKALLRGNATRRRKVRVPLAPVGRGEA